MRLDAVRKRFKNEWVLVEVLDEDKLGNPEEVRVIAHSKDRDSLYAALRKTSSKYTYQFYTGALPKKGYAVAFDG